jgi:hypothetical protein
LGRSGSPDVTALVAGIATVAIGVLLLLDSQGALELTIGALAPIACGVVGAVLLASGLTRRG